MGYSAKVGEEVKVIISKADDGAQASKDGAPFVKANFQQSASGSFIMQNEPASIHLEIWNMSGGWYGARFAIFIGNKNVDNIIIDEGPALPQTVAWSKTLTITPA